MPFVHHAEGTFTLINSTLSRRVSIHLQLSVQTMSDRLRFEDKLQHLFYSRWDGWNPVTVPPLPHLYGYIDVS
jgi:hypothetical protein